MAADPVDDLYDALGEGNLEKIRGALERGANVNQPGDPGQDAFSPLMFYIVERSGAGEDPDIEVVRLLLERGANPNGQAGEPSPLSQLLGYPPIVDLLLERGADPNNGGTDEPPMHGAIRTGNADLVRTLLDRGANVSIPDPEDSGKTPLERATLDNRDEIVQLLLQRGADANVAGSGAQDPPFITAVVSQSPDMIRLFLEKGANANMTSRTGVPAIHLAILPVSIAALAAGGADLNIKNARGETPLTSILKKSGKYRETAAKALLQAGADPNAPNAAGETPLFLALLSGLPMVILTLLDKGGDPRNVRGPPGDSGHPIFYMVMAFIDEAPRRVSEVVINQYEEVILEMLRRGVSPDVRGSDNETMLHMLAMQARYSRVIALIQRLIEAGLNPNAIADDGMTPLENLAYTGGRGAERLVALGFDPNFKNPDGTALLHRIANRPFGPGHQSVHQLARATSHAWSFPGINVNLRNGSGETPLHIAARRNNAEVVRVLLDMGADKTLRVGEDGPLAIELATEENVKSLLRGYAGKSRETVGLLARVFENPANVSMCPVCLAFADREDGCRYMKHVCKEGERNEDLYQRFRGRDGIYLNKIEWCTECGRICDNHHGHYNRAADNIERPGLAPVAAARDPAAAGAVVHYAPDCRPSGGGGLEEKFMRFYQLVRELARLQTQVGKVGETFARQRAIRIAWNAPLELDRTAEEKAVRVQLRELAELLRNPPPAGASPADVDTWNARVLSLKTFGVDMSVFPEDAPPAAEPDAPDFPRPEADRDLLPAIINAGAGPAAAGGGNFCVVELGPHPDNRPTFRFRHRQPNGSIYEHPEEEAICGEDLVDSINSKPLFDGKCVSNPDVCKADLHPDELDALGDQVPEDFRRNYRSKFNRLKAGRLGGGRRKTYRKNSRNVTGRRQRGGKIDVRSMFRKLDDDEYECAIGAF